MTCALVASRLVSMSFVPMLGYVLLRARKKPEKPIGERRVSGFGGLYCKVGSFAIKHHKMVIVASLAILASGVYFKSELIALVEEVAGIMRSTALATRVRQDWARISSALPWRSIPTVRTSRA